VRELAATPDEAPSLVDWSTDSRRIYFNEARGPRGAIYALPVDGPPVVAYRPSRGTLGLGARISGNVAGFSRQSPEEPAEAFILKLDGGEPVQVSRANANVEKPPLGETRAVTWKSKDGAEVEGLLTLPVNYKPGTRVPLILNMHGGPAGVFAETFTGGPGLYPIATFAAKGIAVLRPNPRGSSGYGGNFRRANLGDWGGGDYNDLMSGVDHMIAQGIADPARLAVMGWSYGGYMTAWVVTQTGRFKAGAVGAGLTNLWSMWGTNDIPSVLNDYFNGPPWESFDLYRDRSAMAHISKVTTPTLFLHGEVDLRVPISQAQEMYSALKRRGVATKMVVYPRTAHGPQEPKFVQNVMQQHLDWVEAHLK
jgi:dipeptidyl aminopeptidase/acylaminoacyl peptidase